MEKEGKGIGDLNETPEDYEFMRKNTENQSGVKQATHEELCNKALTDYNEVAGQANIYNSTIYKAIMFYREYGGSGYIYNHHTLRHVLKIIFFNDKTSYYYSGKMSLNRFGVAPHKSKRWETPAEIAAEMLRKMGYNQPYDVPPD